MTTYFITICAHGQRNLLQADQVADLFVATLMKYRDAGEFQVHEYVVMPNHLHVLLSLDDTHSLSRAIQMIKGGFSHALRENGIAMREVWQQRYHDRRIRDDNEFAGIAEYIRQNPVRRGLVEDAAGYKHSSAHNSQGLKPQDQSSNRRDASLKARSTELSNV